MDLQSMAKIVDDMELHYMMRMGQKVCTKGYILVVSTSLELDLTCAGDCTGREQGSLHQGGPGEETLA